MTLQPRDASHSPRGPAAGFWRCVGLDLMRLVLRRRALGVILGLTGIGAFLTELKPWSTPDTFWLHYDDYMAFACPIIGIVISAGSFAEDRRIRYTRLVLLRGYTRRAYAWAKALSVAGSAVVVGGIGLLGFLLTARLRFPPEIWTRPLLPDLVPLAYLAVAAGGLALMSFMASALIENEYIVSFVPFVCLIASVALIRKSRFSPAVHVDAWSDIAVGEYPPPFSVPGEFLYWLVLGGILAAAGSELYAWRQRD